MFSVFEAKIGKLRNRFYSFSIKLRNGFHIMDKATLFLVIIQ